MEIAKGLELINEIEESYLRVEKLYNEFERITENQAEVIKSGDYAEAVKLIMHRHAVIEQIEARNAGIEELKQQLVDGFYTIKEFNMSNLSFTFGKEAIGELSQVIGRLQQKIEKLLEMDRQNQEELRGKLIGADKQRKHLQLGKKTMEAYKKRSLLDSRFLDKRK